MVKESIGLIWIMIRAFLGSWIFKLAFWVSPPKMTSQICQKIINAEANFVTMAKETPHASDN